MLRCLEFQGWLLLNLAISLRNDLTRDFPGGPAVETSLSSAGGAGSIPSQGTGVLHASQPMGQSMEQKQYFNKFNKDSRDGPQQQQQILKRKKKRNDLAQWYLSQLILAQKR